MGYNTRQSLKETSFLVSKDEIFSDELAKGESRKIAVQSKNLLVKYNKIIDNWMKNQQRCEV
ncbi:MAG TPA: hypothetical protein DCP47_01045 [Phycisphaerales bacterium]|nr:hypothetical protein [Phycisphaerales bacterium]